MKLNFQELLVKATTESRKDYNKTTQKHKVIVIDNVCRKATSIQ